MEFRILGPLEVHNASGPIRLGGPKQRALLVLLLLHRGEAMSTDRVVDALWGERAPPAAVKTVQTYVSQLRKALGDGVLATRGHAYVLERDAGTVDAERFGSLVADGRGLLGADEPGRAADRLRAALALWRGPALADVAYEAFAQQEIARLEELRISATEDWVEAELAVGLAAELVPELEALAREHPLRERLRGQLMLALYRSERQADALAAYQDARRRLTEELGLEPGPALRELQRAMLTHDPALRPPRRAALPRRRRGAALLAATPGRSRGSSSRRVAGVVVVSPDDTGIRQARAKTDRLDARTLARLLLAKRPEAVTSHPGSQRCVVFGLPLAAHFCIFLERSSATKRGAPGLQAPANPSACQAGGRLGQSRRGESGPLL
jgi:DNA-binding SARP family transcriptional activator